MSDYDGTRNEFKTNSLIPPELQGIIDKVSGMSMSVGRKGMLLEGLGGVVGGLEQQRRKDASGMAQLGVEQTGAMDREKLQQAGQTERQKIGTAPGLMEATEKTKPQFNAGGLSPTSSAKGLGMGNDSQFTSWQSSFLKQNPFKDNLFD